MLVFFFPVLKTVKKIGALLLTATALPDILQITSYERIGFATVLIGFFI